MGSGRTRYRIDGLIKVTGGNIYARDIAGWPDDQDVVLVLRMPLAALQTVQLRGLL